MTNRNERIQIAAQFGSAIAGAIATQQNDKDLAALRVIRNQPNDVAELALLYADCLLEAIDASEPKPTSNSREKLIADIHRLRSKLSHYEALEPWAET